jgi:glycosyltransferase involved in cell wall biosynthesis
MKVILHVAETVQGGIATVLNQLLLSENCSHCFLPLNQSSYVTIDENKLHLFKSNGRNFFSLISLIFSSFRVIRKIKPDVIHLHSSFSLVLAPFLIFFYKTKVIYQPHGVFYDPALPRSKVKIMAVKALEWFLVLFVDMVISISEHERNLLKRLHSDKKIKLLKNCVSESVAPYVDFTERKGYLFVGRLDEQKGIDLLLDAWRSVDEPLSIIGDSVRSKLKLPDLHNVHYHGWVPADKLDFFFSKAKAVIVPSRWEGFGLVVIESYRNGTPVLTSNRGALPELVKEGQTGFCFNIEEINTALPSCLSDFNRIDMQVMSNNCLLEYKSKYTLPIYLADYAGLVKSLFKF